MYIPRLNTCHGQVVRTPHTFQILWRLSFRSFNSTAQPSCSTRITLHLRSPHEQKGVGPHQPMNFPCCPWFLKVLCTWSASFTGSQRHDDQGIKGIVSVNSKVAGWLMFMALKGPMVNLQSASSLVLMWIIIAIINHPFLMVYTIHLWWSGGWFIIAIPTLNQIQLSILAETPTVGAITTWDFRPTLP